MDNIVISVRNLTNRFGKTTVHQNLDLDVRRGEVLGVVGASGTGKSVLLRSIVGLQRPAAGTITVLGTKILTDPPTEADSTGEKTDAVQNKWGVMDRWSRYLPTCPVCAVSRKPCRCASKHSLRSNPPLQCGISSGIFALHCHRVRPNPALNFTANFAYLTKFVI